MNDFENDLDASLLSDRVALVTMSPTIAISQLAASLKRTGQDILSLAIGEPDFDTPAPIIDAAQRAAEAGFTRYTAADGDIVIKSAVCRKYKYENGMEFTPDEVHVSGGCKQVISNAFAATLNPGDEVILLSPYWVSYLDVVEYLGGKAVIVPCEEAAGFLPNIDQLRNALGPKTKWVVVNSPNNPTGAVYPPELLRQIGTVVAQESRSLILFDEIYEHLLFDDCVHVSLLAAAPQLRCRTLTVNGVSKTFAMTGWRLGYGVGPAWLIEAMARVQSQLAGNCSSISQAAAAFALDHGQQLVAPWRAIMQERRDTLCDVLNRNGSLTCSRPGGAFYVFADVSRYFGTRSGDGDLVQSDRDMATYLLSKARVAVVPGSAFGCPTHIRLSFTVPTTSLKIGVTRICDALEQLVSASPSHQTADWQ
ncbi:MAG: pyridoxal phosphate-dependent aminotransferase [Mesorhizobium sp.]|uniref:pyridoxal phosphate-dependent aminotransferase n=1 Tax=Mesorhizobium sp. TaxID=1871066 RepID=UPI000FE4B39C|nr:pyridoxal phosphate-dependent aminotransferase [Mesorhizobium sp.]RWI08681.1 MAG: pyridoxal phosphate-dependent aminotransferase [Mesorhizobium sp.]RWM85688.1 MAG: pyridoxal phosphate-dependent aminotransferase [Mesorhizobium sp.]TIO14280.1 MAG: pyridoxal phosphate-dependent aminotransferase [Mesorhizobium sp.]TIP92843.1 MAG: pyridoxal phosphate-dependent aminotransferase [Mesorhizobium sp.]